MTEMQNIPGTEVTDAEWTTLSDEDRAMFIDYALAVDTDERDNEFGDRPYNPVMGPDGSLWYPPDNDQPDTP